ncbi:MAG: hypothetical protein HOE83_11320, partial [Alphaproteobacteria bacterium]|nr:hypothetical protein [Alphaproteobacteria bacterium]
MLKGLINRLERQLWARRSYKFVIRNWSVLPSISVLGDVLAAMRASQEITPLVLAAPTVKRVLVVAPHPDDEVIGPGGTLIGAIDAGAKVHVVYLTSGSMEADGMGIREAEAQAAAAYLNYTTKFLRLPSLRESAGMEDAKVLAEAIGEFDPEILFIPFFTDDHIEHRRASELLLMGLSANAVNGDLEIWAYQVYSSLIANVVVDVTANIERKSEAIRLFASQAKSRDWVHFAAG